MKVDNDLYVRDYGKCILCYKCVEACGTDAQNTFAIAVAGRGFDARISTECDVPLPDSACVYCGNCIGVCPTGALMFKSEYDLRAGRARGTSRARPQTDTICPYCGVGCTLTLHVQDNRIVKVTSPPTARSRTGTSASRAASGSSSCSGGDPEAGPQLRHGRGGSSAQPLPGGRNELSVAHALDGEQAVGDLSNVASPAPASE